MPLVPVALGGALSLTNRLVGSTYAIDVSEPTVVLTYDDGPDPAVTERILTHLAEADAKATFFVLMTRVRTARSTLAQMLAEGHEVALHGPDHQALPQFGFAATLRRTRDARAELEDEIGRAVTWFRPPYGAMTPRNQAAVRATGLRPVLWGPMLRDFEPGTVDDLVRMGGTDLRPGSIVLAHDAIADARDGVPTEAPLDIDRPAVTAALLAAYADRGLRTVSLAHAVAQGSERKPVRVRVGARIIDLRRFSPEPV